MTCQISRCRERALRCFTHHLSNDRGGQAHHQVGEARCIFGGTLGSPYWSPLQTRCRGQAMVGDMLRAPPRAASTAAARGSVARVGCLSDFARLAARFGRGRVRNAGACLPRRPLGKAVAIDDRRPIPAARFSLRSHPSACFRRSMVLITTEQKEIFSTHSAAAQRPGATTCFHSSSGGSLLSPRARATRIPSILEI